MAEGSLTRADPEIIATLAAGVPEKIGAGETAPAGVDEVSPSLLAAFSSPAEILKYE